MPWAIWGTSLVFVLVELVPNQRSLNDIQFYCTCSALGTTDMKYLSRIRRSPSDTEGNPALSGNIRTGFPDFVKPPDKEMNFTTQHSTRSLAESLNKPGRPTMLLLTRCWTSWRYTLREFSLNWSGIPGTGSWLRLEPCDEARELFLRCEGCGVTDFLLPLSPRCSGGASRARSDTGWSWWGWWRSLGISGGGNVDYWRVFKLSSTRIKAA